jgi:hypothetical protein
MSVGSRGVGRVARSILRASVVGVARGAAGGLGMLERADFRIEVAARSETRRDDREEEDRGPH